ncbi:MAG: outermembrane efflux protein [SAR86 cluster bacterium]|uniref:Outermembrane efflux protein n=1 Tax=SAR86 cluster bacterium TaxID=2030880 RepID=A0A2A5CBR3_9GAMM|nr:MAG: outermembrane efflux protein [SAR86 cluster bacterium]
MKQAVSHNMKPYLFIVVMALGLSACVSIDVPELPDTDIPEAWTSPLSEAAEVWPTLLWWENFQDGELNTIVQSVKQNNLDLQNNRRNLEAAQIALREAGFNLLPVPTVRIGTGALYTDNFGAAELDNSPSSPVDLTGSFTYNDILSKPATFEGAVADYQSRRAQVANAALNTLGTAASTYFQILLIRDQIKAAQQNLENAEAIGDITQARVDAGVVVPINALQQQIAIEQQRTNIRSLQQNELSALSSLALILGRSVQEFDIAGDTLEDILIPTLRPGIPSELLRRRPDLVQAEAELQRAAVQVELSRLNFFPSISLTGSANASSTSLSELLSAPDTVINLGVNVSQLLLDNGARQRGLEQSRLTLENALNSYRRAVLSAFNEIEVLLSNIQLLEELAVVAQRQLAQAEESFRLAEVRYAEGVADYQTVLTAQNTLFFQRTALLNNKIQQLNSMVGFYQALGGGWDADDETTMSIASE